MLGYVAEALTRFQHRHPRNLQDQPYPHIKTKYGAKSQYAEATQECPPLSQENNKVFQEVTGNLLYHSRAVDPTMLTSLGSIASQQANLTEKTMQKSKQFLDYAATHPYGHHITSEWNGPIRQQQRLVPLQNDFQKQSSWKFMYVQQHRVTTQ